MNEKQFEALKIGDQVHDARNVLRIGRVTTRYENRVVLLVDEQIVDINVLEAEHWQTFPDQVGVISIPPLQAEDRVLLTKGRSHSSETVSVRRGNAISRPQGEDFSYQETPVVCVKFHKLDLTLRTCGSVAVDLAKMTDEKSLALHALQLLRDHLSPVMLIRVLEDYRYNALREGYQNAKKEIRDKLGL